VIPSQLAPTILAALLAILPPHVESTSLIRAHRERVLHDATAALAAYDVPPAVLFAVGWVETWLGEYPGEAHGWGAPIDMRHRHTAGTATTAARVLRRGFERCGTWSRAAAWFRSGECSGDRAGDAYGATVARLVERISARAGVAVPERLR
jgi:hypothetical protein